MIKIEHEEVYGWEVAIRGMRNPMNSWDKSDSGHKLDYTPSGDKIYPYTIGENDLALMRRLAKAGRDHGKFLRMITVTLDITAPLYWWKEFDTYKVGTVANSCSTIHKIHAKKFTMDDFSTDKLYQFSIDALNDLLVILNKARDLYLETKDKGYWWQMIQLLPSSYNQRRTIQLNYEVLRNMYESRKNHKLDEWRAFCEWIEKLPYFTKIVLE